MTITKSRSSSKRRTGNSSFFCVIKPALIGIAAAAVFTFIFIMIFALAFVIMKSIVSSAIIPLSLFAMTIGCFAGAYICGCISRERGFIYGIVIGLMLFLTAYILGMAMGEDYFGSLSIIRLICLLVSGGFGGWFGSNNARTKRK